VNRADTLLKIKDAEAKATQTVKDAQEKQKAIIATARRDAIKRVQDAETHMREENDKAFTNERTKVNSTKADLLNNGKEDAKQVRAKSVAKVGTIRAHLKESFEKSI
jgi:vacuolar-type H+-ATPase subunit H